MAKIDKSFFRYVWRNSRREQITILAVVLASLPLYFWSLDLPKSIVNDAIQGRAFKNGTATIKAFKLVLNLPDFLGGKSYELFGGLDMERATYLFALSMVFFVLVLINGGFKWLINLQKGVMGERMLRRLRFDLVRQLTWFAPEEIRGMKPAEAASMINNEVEPIGVFIGDAFVQPAFLGTQALTALVYILVQSVWLGIAAGGIVAIQGVIIPILRREQIRLGKRRQIASRQLAGRIGEIVESSPAIRAHATDPYERSEIGSRLASLFFIRLDLYNRKFAVKFLNNLLAQLTPFFFYTVGGYLALKGQLDVGQLVAVIAAYRDLPPPVKELIDWDQQRNDVTVKYEQIIEQFDVDEPHEGEELAAAEEVQRSPKISVDGLSVNDLHGTPLVENVSFSIDQPGHITLAGPPGSGGEVVARAIAHQITRWKGTICLNGQNISRLRSGSLARVLAYAGPEPVLFPSTIRDNVVYSLRRKPPELPGPPLPKEEVKRRHEAERSGNPLEAPGDDWLDLAAAGVKDGVELDHLILHFFALLGFEEDIYRLGLLGRIRAADDEKLGHQFVAMREAIRKRLAEEGKSRLVEPFDPKRFNSNATIGENLLFGEPVGEVFAEDNLPSNPYVSKVIEADGLATRLAEIGLRLAEMMLEMFAGVQAGNALYERFSFLASSDLPGFQEIVNRSRSRRRSETTADRDKLISLALAYIEPRHRLGLLDEPTREAIVRARSRLREMIPKSLASSVEFYDPELYCNAAPVRDNLLFGRVAYGIANAQEQVSAVMKSALADGGFLNAVYRIGLDYQIGAHGRLLFPRQRAAVDLARCLVKHPAILVLDDALRAFPGMEAKAMLGRLAEEFKGRLLITALPGLDDAVPSDLKIRFDKGRLVGIDRGGEALAPSGEVNLSARDAAEEQRAREPAPDEATRETPQDSLPTTQQDSPASAQEDEGAVQRQVAE
ncbi:MAG: ABC transporter ATP-binding protein/permease [Hyphomicrobiales bacterium]|nr:ABC transporter ATP-binding protein/permease [Hyphomicrobiales bacterium]